MSKLCMEWKDFWVLLEKINVESAADLAEQLELDKLVKTASPKDLLDVLGEAPPKIVKFFWGELDAETKRLWLKHKGFMEGAKSKDPQFPERILSHV